VWRENAVSSLLRVDPKTGVSLVVPMLLDGEFGEVSAGGVLQELEKVTGGRYYGKVQKLKEWWEKEHQDK
jgi:ABC-type phosphonate transport system ATPase subunit